MTDHLGSFGGYPIRADLPHLDARALPKDLPPRLLERIEEGHRQLGVPFVGVTTDGTPISGLFSLQSTGVSTRPIVEAASAFLAALTAAQRAPSTPRTGARGSTPRCT